MTAINEMRGGEIFLPKNIRSIQIYELANVIISFFKKTKSKIIVTGLRENEKLHEKIISENEQQMLKEFKNVFILDTQKKHSIKKSIKLKNYFSSKKLNFLNNKMLLSYLLKNKLLDKNTN